MRTWNRSHIHAPAPLFLCPELGTRDVSGWFVRSVCRCDGLATEGMPTALVHKRRLAWRNATAMQRADADLFGAHSKRRQLTMDLNRSIDYRAYCPPRYTLEVSNVDGDMCRHPDGNNWVRNGLSPGPNPLRAVRKVQPSR